MRGNKIARVVNGGGVILSFGCRKMSARIFRKHPTREGARSNYSVKVYKAIFLERGGNKIFRVVKGGGGIFEGRKRGVGVVQVFQEMCGG